MLVRKQYPSIRTVLLGISLLFLLLPLGGIYLLGIYQSALIRQTESELISQAAFVAAIYKNQVQTTLEAQGQVHYGVPLTIPVKSPEPFKAIPAKLDLAKDRIYPPRPKPQYTRDALDPISKSAGRQILPVLQDAQQITLSGVKVLDYRGIVVAGQEELGLSFAHTVEFQQAKNGQPVSILRQRRMPEKSAPLGSISRNANINVFVGLPVVLDNRLIGVVWVNRTPTDLTQALYAKRFELAWTGLVLFSVLLSVTALTSYTITQPVQALVRKNRLLAQGNPKGLEPIKNTITREITELSTSIDTMARTIQHRSEYIRNFAAHVSHEFKTPLASIQGSVELLKDNLAEMPQEQQQRFLSNIAEDTERLKQLVTSLLILARADMEAPFNQRVLLIPILTEAASQYQTEHFRVEIESTAEQALWQVKMRPESIQATLNHLFENSCQAGASHVIVSLRQELPNIIMTIDDNGPGISEGNRTEIFTPFFTTRRALGGTGLGLSIVQSLIERQGGQIKLASSQTGACFEVTLPSE